MSEEQVPDERTQRANQLMEDLHQMNDAEIQASEVKHAGSESPGTPQTKPARNSLMSALGLAPPQRDSGRIASFQYRKSALPEEVKDILGKLDRDGDGNLDHNELLACIDSHATMQNQNTFMRRLIIMLTLVVLLLVGLIFGSVILGVELTKESWVKDDGTMTAYDGSVVRTGSNDLSVCADGSMIPNGQACPSGARRLQDVEGPPPTALRTVPLRQKLALASSLSDSFFMALDELVVFSDKGHTLRVQVHGFARVPVLNSRCGNIVHLYTAWNGRLSLDSTDLSFDVATEASFRNAGFELAVGGVNGRRLAGTNSVDGFFSSVQGVVSQSWSCENVPLPRMPQLHKRNEDVYIPCRNAPGAPASCDSTYGGLMPGAAPLPRTHYLAMLPKASRMNAVYGSGAATSINYMKTKQVAWRSTRYGYQAQQWPNHPGQEQITITDYETGKVARFQRVRYNASGTPEGSRAYCNVSVDARIKRIGDAERSSSVDTDLHFEYVDMIEENGIFYRHFRVMSSTDFENMMAADGTGKPDSQMDYWDEAATLKPHRLATPTGEMILFDSLENLSAGTVGDAELESMFLPRFPGASNFDALFTCAGIPDHSNAPEMIGPQADLHANEVEYYRDQFATELAKNTSFHGFSKEFDDYSDSVTSRFGMPDFCVARCPNKVAKYRADAAMEAADTVDATECTTGSLNALIQCFAMDEYCANTAFVAYHSEDCGQNSGGSSRRVKGDVDVPTVHIQVLKDGTKVLNFNQLTSQQLSELGDVFGLEEDEKGKLAGGRLYWNETSDQNGGNRMIAEIPRAEGLATRRLANFPGTAVCPYPNHPVYTQTQLKAGQAHQLVDGVWCMKWEFQTPGSPNTFALEIRYSDQGSIALTASACADVGKPWGVVPPLFLSLCGSGGIAFSTTPSCNNELPFTLSGTATLAYTGELDLATYGFNGWSIQLAALGLSFSAGPHTYDTNCRTVYDEGRRRRRYWSRRRNWRECDSECDLRLQASVFAELGIGIAGVRFAVFVEYYVRNKVFRLGAKLEGYVGWSGWNNLATWIFMEKDFGR